MVRWVVESILHGGPSCFSFQPVFHDWCNKGCCMYNSVCRMMHIKDPLFLIGKSSPLVATAGFLSSYLNGPLPLCLTPYTPPPLYGTKEGNVLFNDVLNTFYLRLYSVRHMVKGPLDSERKPAAATIATLSDEQQGFFYMHYPTDRITHTTAFVTPVVEHWLEREIA